MNRDELRSKGFSEIAPGVWAKSRPAYAKRFFDIENLYEAYLRTGSVHLAALEFKTTGETVRQHLRKAGKKLNHSHWTPDEDAALRRAYAASAGFDLALLAKMLNRTHAAVACRANALAICSERGKHIRTDTAKASCSAVALSGKTIPRERVIRQLKTRVERHGSLCPTGRPRSSWKAEWVEIGGQRFFARSLWEANYARYLQWQKERGEILEWTHEPETFWFEGIKRGSVSYLPDFRVKTWDGAIEYHETKGWMDSRSRTKIRRMKKYHPQITLIVIDGKRYRALSKLCRYVIPGWLSKPLKTADVIR